MASKTDEIIKLRNEGMAYALSIAKQGGIAALEEQVKLRGCLKVSVKFTPEELNSTFNTISDRVYNNILAMVYAVLHDEYGFGGKRLKRFKEMFDQKIYLVNEADPVGRHYARFEDFAAEANRLYDLGIDMEEINNTQEINDSDDRKYVAIDEIIKVLLENEFIDAVELLQKCTEEPRKKLDQKERKKAECRRISDRHNKYYMDANEEENIEYWFNLFGLAMAQQYSFTKGKIRDIWNSVDRINGAIADGKETLSSVKDMLVDLAGIQCDFTKAEVK